MEGAEEAKEAMCWTLLFLTWEYLMIISHPSGTGKEVSSVIASKMCIMHGDETKADFRKSS